MDCFLKESLSEFGAHYLDPECLCSCYGSIPWQWTVFTPEITVKNKYLYLMNYYSKKHQRHKLWSNDFIEIQER